MLTSFYFFLFVVLYPFLFFFNDTATTEIYTLSLHDALPIFAAARAWAHVFSTGELELEWRFRRQSLGGHGISIDRKSTRLNSSHLGISYAVFCLKKKKKEKNEMIIFEYDEYNIIIIMKQIKL